MDECGVCGGSGIPEGACDCDGNTAADGYDCDGNCLADADGDGVCDEFEVAGCQGRHRLATTMRMRRMTTAAASMLRRYDCDGNCLADADGDGVCDEFEVAGCQDDMACNYNADATDDDRASTAADGYDCDGNCLADADGDGVCDHLRLRVARTTWHATTMRMRRMTMAAASMLRTVTTATATA